jgi:hypothetical protein
MIQSSVKWIGFKAYVTCALMTMTSIVWTCIFILSFNDFFKKEPSLFTWDGVDGFNIYESFSVHYTINSELRFSFLNILNNKNQIFNNLSESEKLSYILNPSTPSQVNKLGSFLKKSVVILVELSNSNSKFY